MLKSTQWLAATGSYGRLTLAHKVAALGQTRNIKAEKKSYTRISVLKVYNSIFVYFSKIFYMKNLHPFWIFHIALYTAF